MEENEKIIDIVVVHCFYSTFLSHPEDGYYCRKLHQKAISLESFFFLPSTLLLTRYENCLLFLATSGAGEMKN